MQQLEGPPSASSHLSKSTELFVDLVVVLDLDNDCFVTIERGKFYVSGVAHVQRTDEFHGSNAWWNTSVSL